jgi:Putative lumazine-binding
MSGQESGPAAAVRAVMERYVEAVYKADVDTLRGLFHPAAVMSGYLGEMLLAGPPEPFLVDVGGRPSMESAGALYTAGIVDIHASSRTASLRLEETGFFGIHSYFHLLNVEGEWKIVSKTFESL